MKHDNFAASFQFSISRDNSKELIMFAKFWPEIHKFEDITLILGLDEEVVYGNNWNNLFTLKIL